MGQSAKPAQQIASLVQMEIRVVNVHKDTLGNNPYNNAPYLPYVQAISTLELMDIHVHNAQSIHLNVKTTHVVLFVIHRKHGIKHHPNVKFNSATLLVVLATSRTLTSA